MKKAWKTSGSGTSTPSLRRAPAARGGEPGARCPRSQFATVPQSLPWTPQKDTGWCTRPTEVKRGAGPAVGPSPFHLPTSRGLPCLLHLRRRRSVCVFSYAMGRHCFHRDDRSTRMSQEVCQSDSTRHEQPQTPAEDRPAGALPPKRSLGRDVGASVVTCARFARMSESRYRMLNAEHRMMKGRESKT